MNRSPNSCRNLVVLLTLLFVFTCAPGGAVDHDELGKVLRSMPANGPFWRYGNVVLGTRARKAGLAPVVFAHWSHRARYTCRVCHTELGFSMRQGDSGITREEYLAGKYCGVCHDGASAFSVRDPASCKKCHMENTKELEAKFDDFAQLLPLAPFGNGIDWSQALKRRMVQPVDVIGSSAGAMTLPKTLQQPLKLGTTSPRSDVTFSHKDHFAELDCASCHPDIFNIKKKSTTSFTMETNIYGSFCGACHMLVAFPMNDCRRCHQMMSNARSY